MMTSKASDTPTWYDEVIKKAELIEDYPVKGCFTLRPCAYRMWELIQSWFDGEIKQLGVENAYFPMFIPKVYLEMEAEHLDDFAPELAWVTRCGDRAIDEVALRPSSETAMYASFSKWVQSHRDLPLKINQWCSMIRWEVKQTTPFLRMRENLWQEGHTAYADKESAEKEVLVILDKYAHIYENLLAVPVIRGTKTRAETFAGAEYSTTVEAFIPATGRAIQGATSHHLGQKFSKMFDISFQDPADSTSRQHAWQNSWGITTRTLGVMIMVHGDDRGLVMPPRVASVQVVIVPVGLKATSSQEDKDTLRETAERYLEVLKNEGVRVRLDDGDQRVGWKFSQWEMKGVPLRIELGLKDIQQGTFVMAKRNVVYTRNEDKDIGHDCTMVQDVLWALDDIHADLYAIALCDRDAHIVSIDIWADLTVNLNQGKLLLVPFCGSTECEKTIKEKSKEEAAEGEVEGGLKMGAKSLCVPHEARYQVACSLKCINPECDRQTEEMGQRTLFGRSY